MARQCTTSDYFTIGTASALQLTGDLTILCWINGTATGPLHLLGFYDLGGIFAGYGVRVDGAGKLAYWSNNIGAWVGSTSAVNSGTWRPVGVTISGTGASAGTFWVDGATDGTWTHTAPTVFTGNKFIGANSSGTSILGYTIAELAIWDVALSPAQITDYVNGVLASGIQSGDLVAYWRFLGTGATEPDSGPNGYTATVVGTPTQVDHPPVYLSGPVQTARPSADTYNGDGWTEDDGTTTSLFDQVDETIADDADYIRSPVTPTSDAYVTKLGSLTDPTDSAGHTLRYRYGKDASGGDAIDLIVQLRQGYVNESTLGTLIASWTHSNIAGGWTLASQTLSAGEADSITNYNDLYLRMVANKP